MDESAHEAPNHAKGLEGVEGEPTRKDLEEQQEHESQHVGLGTQAQSRGAVAGSVVGAVIGVVLGGAVALIALRDVAAALIVMPLIGLAFGAVAGGVYEGGRNPEREGELRTTRDDPDPSAAVESNPD